MPTPQSWDNNGSKTNISTPFSVNGKQYTIRIDANINQGRVSGSRLTLQDTVSSRGSAQYSGVRSIATSTDGGRTWKPELSSDGKPVLPDSELKLLQPGKPLYNAARNASQSTARSQGASPVQVNDLNKGNASSNTEQIPEDSGISSITEIKVSEPNVVFKEISDESKKLNRLQYPLDMKNDQDKIKFQACEFQKRENFKISGLEFKFPRPKYEPIKSRLNVVLGIQASISDQNSVNWGPDTMSPIEAAFYQKSLDFIRGGPDAKEPNDTLNSIVNNAKKYKSQLQQYAAGQAVGLNNIIARTDNSILNPNIELLFTGPQLRPFTFQFKMSARNKDEAQEIKNIIKYFKYYMAVRETDDGLFLKSPHVFTIQYMKGENIRHSGINLISPSASEKACALTNCSVDYTPLGSYMTYEDGTMVSYTLSLQFQEIEPIYNTDYEIEHPIGF